MALCFGTAALHRRVLWRISPSRSRRSPPAGFVRPCQPRLVDRPPVGGDGLHEVKHDGYRLIARKEGERVKLWTRHGTDFTDRLQRIAATVRSLPAERILIDGEAVALRPDGRSDFETLRTQAGAVAAAYVVFDLLELNGKDIRQQRLEDRRAGLSASSKAEAILFSEAIEAEGALVFAKACEMGLEGIVSKRAGSRYFSGPSKSWLKAKNPTFLRYPLGTAPWPPTRLRAHARTTREDEPYPGLRARALHEPQG
jgi:bifunctional non-homologous end joining protein LigD